MSPFHGLQAKHNKARICYEFNPMAKGGEKKSILSFHPKVITPSWNVTTCTLLLSVQLPGGMEGQSSDPREWEQPCSFGMVL